MKKYARGMELAGEKLAMLKACQRQVYIVDDDADLRRSLQFLLNSHQIGATPFSGGTAFLSQLHTLRPAPILLDIRMPRMDGTQVLAELVKRQNKWPVVVLTGHGEVGVAVRSLKLGAHDFLEKPVKSENLMLAVESAFELLLTQTLADVRHANLQQQLANLTTREYEVLFRLSAGCSNKQVAFDLSLSTRTVEMHRANAFRHLEVRTLVEAAALLSEAATMPKSAVLLDAFKGEHIVSRVDEFAPRSSTSDNGPPED